jgi:hypothetical protein
MILNRKIKIEKNKNFKLIFENKNNKVCPNTYFSYIEKHGIKLRIC